MNSSDAEPSEITAWARGEWLAKSLRLDELVRTKILPISFGFPLDAHVRHVMQRALDALAAQRRLPVIG